jgi:hypothetical protein
MTDVFSQYVTLLDEIEQIPAMARESPSLSSAQRAALMTRVVELVRDRVIPQSDRDAAGREALLDDGREVLNTATVTGVTLASAGDDAIAAAIDALDRANPSDAPRVQRLLYRVHAEIAGRFSRTELMLASIEDDELPVAGTGRITGRRIVRDESAGASTWFG